MTKRRGRLIAIAVAAIVLCLAVTPDVASWWVTRGVRPGARPAARAVVEAYWWSRITGAYWEDEIGQQARRLDRSPLEDRLDLFTSVIVHCDDLDTSRAYTFAEEVGEDATALSKHLRTVQAAPAFGTLSRDVQRHVETWTSEMELLGRACDGEARSALASPDGTWTATWWIRGCMTSSSVEARVSVHRASADFRADESSAFGIWGNPDISIRWVDRSTLSIRCAGCDPKNISQQVSAIGNVHVNYDFPGTSKATK